MKNYSSLQTTEIVAYFYLRKSLRSITIQVVRYNQQASNTVL